MKSLKDDPKDEKFNGILVGIPTFGTPSINFTRSIKMAGTPIFTSQAWYDVIGKPVDVARNEIAGVALSRNFSFVWFRDDDVLAEPEALIKLMGRLSPEQRAKPREVGEVVIGGVVYSKVCPPQPMIYRSGIPGGYEDWGLGDLVECDSIGMGCTVIPTGVFRRILESGYEKFQCVNDKCRINWSVVHGPEVGVCPTCGAKLTPIFFKTVRGGDGLDFQSVEMTEDTYFCLLAKDCGVGVYADAGVQCQHEDKETWTKYYYHPGIGMPVWEKDGVVDFYPQIPSEEQIKNAPKRENINKDKKVRFNVGCGGVHKKGFVNIDLNTEADFVCDGRDLRPAIIRYGQADEIESDHMLEHVNRTAVPATFRNWIKALKPGGVLRVRVPDARAAMEGFLEADDGAKAMDYDFAEAVVFGRQAYDGDTHMAAITPNKMKRLIRSCTGMIESHKVEVGRFKGMNQDEIVVEVIKKKSNPRKKEKK
jgi:hypothetical protein